MSLLRAIFGPHAFPIEADAVPDLFGLIDEVWESLWCHRMTPLPLLSSSHSAESICRLLIPAGTKTSGSRENTRHPCSSICARRGRCAHCRHSLSSSLTALGASAYRDDPHSG